MTQEEKDLLLKDLCGRLPYGIKAAFFDIEDECENFDVVEYIDVSNKEHEVGIGQYCLPIDKIKPYLFPLSSMTAEQKTSHNFLKHSAYANPIKLIDFYNKHHLDYRGLIPMGLAIDAINFNIY